MFSFRLIYKSHWVRLKRFIFRGIFLRKSDKNSGGIDIEHTGFSKCRRLRFVFTTLISQAYLGLLKNSFSNENSIK